MCPAIRQTMSHVRRQPEGRTPQAPATRPSHTTCRARRAAMTALPGRTAARQTLATTTTLRRPTISGTAPTTRRRRREAVRKAATPGAAQPPRSRGRPPTTRTMQLRRTRLLELMAPVVPALTAAAAVAIRPARVITRDALTAARRRATPPDAAMGRRPLTQHATTDRLRRTGVGVRDRTPRRTLRPAATMAAAEVVTTAEAAVVTVAAVADTDSQQRI